MTEPTTTHADDLADIRSRLAEAERANGGPVEGRLLPWLYEHAHQILADQRALLDRVAIAEQKRADGLAALRSALHDADNSFCACSDLHQCRWCGMVVAVRVALDGAGR